MAELYDIILEKSLPPAKSGSVNFLFIIAIEIIKYYFGYHYLLFKSRKNDFLFIT